MILYLGLFIPSLNVVVVETNILAANTSNASKSSAPVSRLLSYLFHFLRNFFFCNYSSLLDIPKVRMRKRLRLVLFVTGE